MSRYPALREHYARKDAVATDQHNDDADSFLVLPWWQEVLCGVTITFLLANLYYLGSLMFAKGDSISYAGCLLYWCGLGLFLGCIRWGSSMDQIINTQWTTTSEKESGH